MTRLSTLDASFLRVETPTAHMHVGWFSMLELPEGSERLDAGALLAQIESRLHLAPRFRQRLQEPPLPVGEPCWRDDPAFEIRRHVTVVDSPPVGSRRLRELTDDFLSTQLPRNRPLWSLLVIPAVVGGRAAIVGKVHHAMVDGLAAVELGVLLFDPESSPDSSSLTPVAWSPAPDSGPLRVLLDTVADSALEQFRAARGVAALGLSPGEARRVVGTVRRAALSLADDALRPAPASHLNVPIGPRRTLSRHRLALARVERLKHHYGMPLNDVVLAITSGALRRLALAQREPPVDLRVMIPVSVRRPDEDGGNRITFAFVELPVESPDPLQRLQRIHAQTRELKGSGRIAGTEMLLRSIGSLPEPLKRRAARLAASPRLYNLTVSNVPGPRTPLYAAGARVRSIYPVIPIPDCHALAIGVLTYAGGLHVAAYADPVALPRLGRLPAMFEDSLAELSVAAGTEAHPPRLRRGPRLAGERSTASR